MPSIVLFRPSIPGNTGSIGRTCLALNYRLILIRPYGFELTQKAVRRAGLDYWKHLDLLEYDSFEDFLKFESPSPEELIFLSKFGKSSYYQAPYHSSSYLVFGNEVDGLPEEVHLNYKESLYSIPMLNPKIRSLNLSNAATCVAYECHRQLSSSII